MLQQYKEDRLFEYQDRYGDDVMLLVAVEGHVCVMEVLHKAGAGVSNINARGRTLLILPLRPSSAICQIRFLLGQLLRRPRLALLLQSTQLLRL